MDVALPLQYSIRVYSVSPVKNTNFRGKSLICYIQLESFINHETRYARIRIYVFAFNDMMRLLHRFIKRFNILI